MKKIIIKLLEYLISELKRNKEEWKVVEGFENYQISNKGRVKSRPRPGTNGGILIPYGQGGDIVKLHKKGQSKTFNVNELIEKYHGKK